MYLFRSRVLKLFRFKLVFSSMLCILLILNIELMKTQKYGANSFTIKGSILWNALCDGIKACYDVAVFKKKKIGWKGKLQL